MIKCGIEYQHYDNNREHSLSFAALPRTGDIIVWGTKKVKVAEIEWRESDMKSYAPYLLVHVL